jgi:hypothetical protein
MGSVTSVVSVVTTGLDVRDFELELDFQLLSCCRCISWGHKLAVRDTAGRASVVLCEGHSESIQ